VHALHFPIVIPASTRLPLPPQNLQLVVLWPWHLGHKNNLFMALLFWGLVGATGIDLNQSRPRPQPRHYYEIMNYELAGTRLHLLRA
jgi:hypothetical protein